MTQNLLSLIHSEEIAEYIISDILNDLSNMEPGDSLEEVLDDCYDNYDLGSEVSDLMSIKELMMKYSYSLLSNNYDDGDSHNKILIEHNTDENEKYVAEILFSSMGETGFYYYDDIKKSFYSVSPVEVIKTEYVKN